MPTGTVTTRKITISLPHHLVDFADQYAQQINLNRSQVIGEALATIKAMEEERLAAEGYQFYAEESTDFTVASNKAVAEAWGQYDSQTG